MQLVIVGGFPRAGTRQFTDLLNQHDDIALQGEIHRPVFQAMSKMFRLADEHHAGTRTAKSYSGRRQMAALEIYRLMSKSNAQPKEFDYSMGFLGFKQPLIERDWKPIRRIFQPDHEDCHFFCCIRNMYDNYLSLHSAFDWDTLRYKAAIGAGIEGLQRMMADPFFKVHPLPLDDYIGSGQKGDWARRHLFDPLGISAGPDWYDGCVERTRNRNKTPPDQRKEAMDPADIEALLEARELTEAFEWMEQTFSLDLLGKLRAARAAV
ncbi:MAG: hypothetical protein JJT81_19075 [Rubellimicrobium sp.]|nr:hypothetical protein [Rubellimicrobium sp.]